MDQKRVKKIRKRIFNYKLTIKQNENILYQGKTEEIPKDLKEKEYNKIYFEGGDVIVEI